MVRDQTPKVAAEGKKQFATPTISLPKGGGAIKGIGEKFAANPVTGTGSFTVPIATSPGRSGFGPQLSLSYDSGAGNGPFGFGWSLGLPAITRKTDKGLPQYRDEEESDVFILSGSEDLVPIFRKDENGQWVLDAAGSPVVDERERDGYAVRPYRPRIEGLFARIERWTRRSDGDVHWRSISKDNVLTVYGKDAGSRIAARDGSQRIFSWLICETRDDKGNAVVYDYKREDAVGADLGSAHQRNRGDADDPRRGANLYVKRIRYGNREPLLLEDGRRPRLLSDDDGGRAGWMFEVVFDYGEHDLRVPTPSEAVPWGHRDDAFSSYRAGFEVRTCRLCRRVLMFHHFEGEEGVGRECLVRSIDFSYSAKPPGDDSRNAPYAFLIAVTHSGYRRQDGAYLQRSLPPVEFEYSQPTVQDVVREVDAENLENIPIGIDGATYHWTDLHGEGIPGILTDQGGAWFYKRNLSPLSGAATFAPAERVASRPNVALFGGHAQLMDLAGDGQPDLVILEGPTPGFYEHDDGEGWEPFRPFASRLARDTRDPNLRFVDLDGDGHADVLITEDDAFVWHPSLGEEGFGPALRVPQAFDEESGPRLIFADGTQSVHLADMSGDGLSDLVRIRNGEVCYWPNLGHGRFGAKVTMDDAPLFDHPDQFDQRRIRLADIDGTGTTDIVYLHRDGVRLYFNRSGNRWGEAMPVRAFPRIDDVAAVAVNDLLGNGTACLVWSSPLPGDAGLQMRYVDLMGGQKPHLLVRTTNNLGAETRVEYAPSTKFYLQDRRDGTPWITRLPFPVHVVERVLTRDLVGRNRFVTRYAYHHGYFDGEEREFRGFGRVDQWDTEELAALGAREDVGVSENEDPASYMPPVLTKTWFHTGVYVGRDHVSDFFAGIGPGEGEYYREPSLRGGDALDAAARALLLDDTVLPRGLTLEEEREACRALKGSMLRQEVYALDGTPKAEHPYTVTEQSFTIRGVQPRGGNRHAVFLAHPLEAIHYHYERNPADPRIDHALTLEVDDFGNVLREAAVAYGRRETVRIVTESRIEERPNPGLEELDPLDRPKQTKPLVTYTVHRVTNAIVDPTAHPDDHRTPLPAETRTYELSGIAPGAGAARFAFEEWTRDEFALPTSAVEIPYEQVADGSTPQKRLVEDVRTVYRRNDLTDLLPVGVLESLAVPGDTYKLAFTPGLLRQVFRRTQAGEDPEDLLPPDVATLLGGMGADQGGYHDLDGDGRWWVPAGRTFLSPGIDDPFPQELEHARRHFFLPLRYRDPFGQTTTVRFDAYDLLMLETRDPLDNRVSVGERTAGAELVPCNDYRVLQPRLVTDPNGNRVAAAFDALGLVVGTAVMGKPSPAPAEGDSLAGFEADLAQEEMDGFYDADDPHAPAPDLLKDATTRIVYDLDRFRRTRDADPDDPAQWLPPYAARLARERHVQPPSSEALKIQITFSYSDGFGREIQKKVQAEPGPVVENGPEVDPRWVGSGWMIFNNKGRPVRQYEPFFSALPERRHRFEFGKAVGVSTVLFYDPVERVVATLHPNATYEKVVFDPWRQTTYGVDDTAAPRGGETGDPRTDADVSGFVAKHLQTLPGWQTWYQQRVSGAMGASEQTAAEKTAVHADTPTTAHSDALGRAFLTVAHNRFERDGAVVDEGYPTRIELDIEGNQRGVRDAIVQNAEALGRVVMRWDYDMLGTRIHQASMDAGERWLLNDVTGKPIRAWDSRGFVRRMTYDALRRPTGLYVAEDGIERLAERTVYGEEQGDARNHRTRVYQVFDGAGIVTSVAYDFKGNPLESRRDLLPLPGGDQDVDWSKNPVANDGSFTTRTTYDALNRQRTVTSPDGSVQRAIFNEANLLEKIDVNLRGEMIEGEPRWTPFVTDVDYDAKGQRTLIVYGNGARTTYEYDPLTYRLVHLNTTQPSVTNGIASQIFADPKVVQDLLYTYDPAGNITRIEDAALKVVFHANQKVEPICEYTYDAIHRLIKATGREHIGQCGFQFDPPDGNYRDYPFVGAAHPNDLQALRKYTERYEYDAVGNFEYMRHIADGGTWTREYRYEAESLLEPGKTSNRLTTTRLGDRVDPTETYTHDAHGNMTSMPHLASMAWEFKDQLQAVGLGGGGTAHYVYDATGQRIRKVIATRGGARSMERIYLGGIEIYREYEGAVPIVEVERLTLHVLDSQQRIASVDTEIVSAARAIDGPAPLKRYQLGNHLGSACVELDASASLISYEEYHAYGTTAFLVKGASAMQLRRHRFTGRERDEETGFSYHRARYYAPWLARWVSCDPLITLPQAQLLRAGSPFVYSANTPAMRRDIDGMQESPPNPGLLQRLGKWAKQYAVVRAITNLLGSGEPADWSTASQPKPTPGQLAAQNAKPDRPVATGSDPPETTFDLARSKERAVSARHAASQRESAEVARELEKRAARWAERGRMQGRTTGAAPVLSPRKGPGVPRGGLRGGAGIVYNLAIGAVREHNAQRDFARRAAYTRETLTPEAIKREAKLGFKFRGWEEGRATWNVEPSLLSHLARIVHYVSSGFTEDHPEFRLMREHSGYYQQGVELVGPII